MPSTGLQALILCGPGSSFPTFTSNPDENPKALLPIANRPMVWYPIDFCLRTGITGKSHGRLLAPPTGGLYDTQTPWQGTCNCTPSVADIGQTSH